MHDRVLRTAAIVVAAGLLAGCESGVDAISGLNPFASGAEAESFAPVASEEAFRAQVVGREVVYENGAVGTYGADGTWTVATETGTLARGTWEWRGDRWCYEGAAASGAIPESCEAVAVSETGVRFTREDGSSGILPFRT